MTKIVNWPLKGLLSFNDNFSQFVIIFANFKKSSPLKLLNQIQPNFNWMISRVYKIKFVFYFLFCLKTWPSWLKIEHRVKCSFWLISQILQHLEQIRQEVKRPSQDQMCILCFTWSQKWVSPQGKTLLIFWFKNGLNYEKLLSLG